ncbi:hypothetical protein [Lelliottia wanjuensis]|uniref:hypothetical protein n=1 Tax=Lelliottia wanjuensis TaxID=3050585 RepID=UPI00254E35CE|nr:hypothetical protein [Lelliottia sp. V104_15]MDK9605040.1 hypothetical protein [Lelliottia sp. V104_15]
MDRFTSQPPTWENYMGDVLRGNVPPNQLIPQHPYLLDTLKLEEILHKNIEHIMLLTVDEAYAAFNEIYDKGTTYAGNIKDATAGAKNIFKLASYRDAGKLIFRFKGLGIKAQSYLHKGVTYIKITGYPSVRQILNATRYTASNPKILEVGIGKAGINAGILSGARFCIYFAAAQRVVEYIFSSQHDVATFIGNITMDVAKVIVTIFITRILFSLGSGLAVLGSSVIPISVGIVIIVFIGIAITTGLMLLDKKYKLSDRLIQHIRDGMVEQQKIMHWNMLNTNSHISLLINGIY